MIDQWAGTIVDSIFDVILVTDQELKILDSNTAVIELGHEKAGVIGKSIFDLMADPLAFRQAFPELVKAAQEGRRELRRMEALRKDGSRFWVDISATEIETTSETDYLIVLHDVDDRAKARKELEEQKSRIEAVLQETDRLRKEAEYSRSQLEVANSELAKRQLVTETALLEEQKIRFSAQKTGFQKTFVTYLALLICASLLLPYLSMLGFISEKITDSTGNLSLLLIQALTGVSGFIFGQRSGKEQEKAE